MSKKKKQVQEDSLVAVESALTKTEQFFEDNQKLLIGVVLGIVLIVSAYIGYNKLYRQPLEQEALSQAFMAQQYFERDSFNLALNGDANYPGFLEIIDNYGSTKTGNLAKYYAGVCFLRTGKYDEAIEYLKKFESNDKMLAPIALGMIGDAYMQKNDLQTAVKYYKKASETHPNDFVSPIYLKKMGIAYETMQDWQAALDTYEKIYKEFPTSNEGRDIEKYIENMKIKLNKAN